MRTEVEVVEPEDFYIRGAVQAMRDRGIKVNIALFSIYILQ